MVVQYKLVNQYKILKYQNMNEYIIKVIYKDNNNDEMTMNYYTVSIDLESAIQEVTTVVNDRITKYGGEIISINQDI